VAQGQGGFALNPELETNAALGSSIAALGDINGDGLADFAIGATGKDQNGFTNTGRAYVVFGKKDGAAINMADLISGHSPEGFAIIAENQSSTQLGYFMDRAGDINGDGLQDLIVTAPYMSVDGKTSAGRSYVVYGKADTANVNLADGDVVGTAFEGRGFGQAHHAVFGGGISRRLRSRGVGRNRAIVDDAPTLRGLRLHDAEGLAQAQKHARQIDVHHTLPLGQGQLVNGRRSPRARVVKKQVQVAKAVNGLGK